MLNRTSPVEQPIPDRLMFRGGTLADADLSGQVLKDLLSVASRFERCNFSGSTLRCASLGGGTQTSEYVGCTFDRATIDSAIPGVARFVNCSFLNVRIRCFYAITAEIENCVFSGVIERTFFNGTVPAHLRRDIGRTVNRFAGNDFSLAKFRDVDFRTGIDLTKQVLPKDEGHVVIDASAESIGTMERQVNSWSDSEQREEGEFVLKIIRHAAERGQREVFLQVPNLPMRFRSAARTLLVGRSRLR